MSKRAERKAAEGRKPTGGGSRFGSFCRLAWRGIYVSGAFFAMALLVAGLAVRLTVRDEMNVLAVIYYATPWPVLAVCALWSTWFWRRWRKIALGLAIITLSCAGAWVWTGFHRGPKDGGTADFRVAYWNCARPGWRLRGILPMATSWQADLLGFGESHATGPLSPKWAEAFPQHRVQLLPREMLLVGPAAMDLKNSGSLGGGGEFQLITTTLGGREVFVLVVDVDGQITKSRQAAFDRLCQVVDGFATKPLIVMGDFNTPGDSVYFQRLRTRLSDAFETAGSGAAATWPMVAPVLSLDHILVNKFLRVVRCEHRTSIYSDHRAVVAEIAWR